MTIIAILGGDFEILFEDETTGTAGSAGMKMVRRTAAATATVYTTNALYSAVADAADDFQAMGFENPMLPVTPNAYTMENDYFIPRSSTEWLEEGAIAADWSVVAGVSGVIRKIHDNTGTAPAFVDIGREVIETTSGHGGTLLDFEVEPDGTFVLWIRPNVPGTDTFALATNLTTVADGGSMSVGGALLPISGATLYSSIQVIGSVPTATEVYLYQDRAKMTDSTGGFQWWVTDTTVSLGIIDILIRVKNADTLVADGDVEVFARRYTSLYDNFRLNIAAGGRSALPLASAPDTNNTTGYRTVTNSGGTGTAWTVGNGIYQGATWASATARGVITAVSGTVADPVLEYYLVGDLTEFSAGVTTMTEWDFTLNGGLGGNGDAAATTTGTPGVNLTGPTDTASTEGGTVTITLGNNSTIDHDGDAVNESYSVTIDAQGNVPAAKVYERIKYVTRRGSDTTFWDTLVPTDIPGETYRGLELQAQIVSDNAAFNEGDNVDVLATGYTARAVSRNGTDTYVMLTDQQSSIKTLSAADVLRDEDVTDTVTITGTPVAIVSPKNSPFGTFTGTQIFGARGVVYINPDSADTQNYILIDDDGNQRTPPNLVTFAVSNTVAGDRVLVARDTGTAGIIDKDQFGGVATGALAAGTLTVTTTPLDPQVAPSGYLRVVETTLQEEHHYVYSSRVLSSGIFTLTAITDATATTASEAVSGIATLQVNARDFVVDGVEVGMLLRNLAAGKTTHVWEVATVGATHGSPALYDEIGLRQLYGDATGSPGVFDIDVGDTFTINKLIGDHTAPAGYTAVTDKVYDLYLDVESAGGTVSNTFVKTVSDPWTTVVNVRQGKIIIPFTTNQPVGDSGATVTVVRTPDTIAT